MARVRCAFITLVTTIFIFILLTLYNHALEGFIIQQTTPDKHSLVVAEWLTDESDNTQKRINILPSSKAGNVTNQQVSALQRIDLQKFSPWLNNSLQLPYNVSWVRDRQMERHRQVAQNCMAGSGSNARDLFRRSTLFIHEDLLFCPILKAGSTNILRLLCWLVGPKCSSIERLKPHNMVPRFLDIGGSELIRKPERFAQYFSFAFVRNPWSRLVSVYIQKFVETRQGIHFCQLDKRMPEFYKVRFRDGLRLTFNEFITLCVINQWEEGGIIAQNGHWRPQHYMCAFCQMNFTFIGKVETMDIDERVVLHRMGFEDIDKTISLSNSKLLSNEKENRTAHMYKDLWDEIPEESRVKLREIYKLDLSMFEYPANPL